MEVTFIIVNYKTKELVARGIDSILKFAKGFAWEIIVVDNNSQDGSVEFLKKKYPNTNFECFYC